ncbi:hypothetical protein L6232_23720, partial [Shewanella sp. C31]|nr:hypothetical protein [Shewanella electrica]
LLAGPQAAGPLGLALLAGGLALFVWWTHSFPHGLAAFTRTGLRGRYNPLDPEFQRLAEGEGRKGHAR